MLLACRQKPPGFRLQHHADQRLLKARDEFPVLSVDKPFRTAMATGWSWFRGGFASHRSRFPQCNQTLGAHAGGGCQQLRAPNSSLGKDIGRGFVPFGGTIFADHAAQSSGFTRLFECAVIDARDKTNWQLSLAASSMN